MRVPCPACDAVYEIPDRLLAEGPRRLRCARCAQEWLAGQAAAPRTAASPIAAPPVAAQPVPAQIVAPAAPARAVPPPALRAGGAGGGLLLGLGWLATGILVAGGVAALLHWPAEVTEAFPPAARLYASIGVTVPESALSTSPAR